MNRRTKIVCTLGPASSSLDVIRRMIAAGMDVARLNFSHGTHEEHRRRLDNVREAAAREGRAVPILQDLQGPKIRVGEVRDGGVNVKKGQRLVLSPHDIGLSDARRVHVSYPTLAEDVAVGGRILLDDGLLELEVKAVEGDEVVTEVVVGGPLRSRKGVNLPHLHTSAPSLTEKDLEDLDFGLELGVDFVALSFVRDPADVADLVRRVRAQGRRTGVIAKIEKPEALGRIDDIIAQADGIMVARGDLGIEMPMSKVPAAQKSIIQKCRVAARPVITATQMLESMIENPRPTRAEASDVANAVLDGSDALMLSGETAAGRQPVRVVEVMARIIEQAELYQLTEGPRMDLRPERGLASDVTESISYTAVELAEQVQARAICCLTASGTTARTVARHRPNRAVYAFTDDERVVGQLGLVWGTKGFKIPFQRDTDEGVNTVHRVLNEHGLVEPGDLIVITAGMPLPAKGRTNMVHVSRI